MLGAGAQGTLGVGIAALGSPPGGPEGVFTLGAIAPLAAAVPNDEAHDKRH